MNGAGKVLMRKSSGFVIFSAVLGCLLMSCPASAETPPDTLKEEPASITLQDGLRIVTSESHLVRIARQDEEIAYEDSMISKAKLYPTLTASASHTDLVSQPATRLVGGQAVPISDTGFYAFNVTIQQILYDFKGLLSQYRATRTLFEAKKLSTASTRNRTALDFTINFYDTLESQKLIDAAVKEVERVESHLRDAKSLYDAGVITKNDMLQAQVRLSDARQRLLSARNLRDVRVSRLNTFLLMPLTRKVELVEYERPISDPSLLDIDKFWDTALSKRPEVQIADRTVEALGFEAVAKKSEFLPQLFASGSYDYMQNAFSYHDDNWTLLLGVRINLFEGGKTLADLRKTEHRKKQVLEQRANLVDEIRLEVKNFLLDLRNAYERILVNRDSVEQAQENLRINRSRYEGGIGTATEVLDAVILLSIAETNHIHSVYDYRKSEAAAYYAAGEDFLELYK